MITFVSFVFGAVLDALEWLTGRRPPHQHQWQASELHNLDECALCDATRDRVPTGQ